MRRAHPLIASTTGVALAFAGLGDSLFDDLDHPAIQYGKTAADDLVARLSRKMQEGDVRLAKDSKQGYLRAVLRGLDVPVESQIAIFSKTSVQMRRIEPRNPRTLFFNDSVIVGWVRGGFMELAAQDPRQGVIFYTLQDLGSDTPVFLRSDSCLSCHESYASMGVPGTLVRSVFPAASGEPMYEAGSFSVDHRTAFENRWGGYYVTGKSSPKAHMGNALLQKAGEILPTLEGKFETGAYLSPYSDVVALMVFDHQLQGMNLLTRAGWEVRRALFDRQNKTGNRDVDAVVREVAREVVDYLLFVDEAKFDGKVEGSSGFAEEFAARGPFDAKGRSLRQFDLEKRLFRYPLSYLIYSPAFDGLPAEAREAIYARLREVLTGGEKDPRYARLSAGDRAAVWEILRDTKLAQEPERRLKAASAR